MLISLPITIQILRKAITELLAKAKHLRIKRKWDIKIRYHKTWFTPTFGLVFLYTWIYNLWKPNIVPKPVSLSLGQRLSETLQANIVPIYCIPTSQSLDIYFWVDFYSSISALARGSANHWPSADIGRVEHALDCQSKDPSSNPMSMEYVSQQ